MTTSTPVLPSDADPGDETIADARRILRRAFRVAAPQQLVGLVAGLSWRAAAIGTPWAIQNAVDDGIIADDSSALRRWCLVLVGLGLVTWIGDAVRHLNADRSGYLAMVDLRHRTLAALLNADPEHTNRFAAGDVITRLVEDCGRVRIWITAAITGTIATLTLVAVIVLVAALDPWLAAVALAVVPLSALLALNRSAPNREASTASMAASGRTAAWIEASVAGIETVKGLGAESTVLAHAEERVAESRARSYALASFQAGWLATANAIPGIGIAIGLMIGGTRAIDGAISVGELLAFTGWMALLTVATTTLTSRLGVRGVAMASAQRLAAIQRLPAHPAASGHEWSAPPTSSPDTAPGGGVAVRAAQVALRRGDLAVLEGVSFRADPGTWTAVVGATGAGKSSLLRAIAGDLPLAAGTLTIAGVDVAGLQRPARRGLVSLVPQNPTLITGSVAEILRRGAPHANDHQLDQVLEVCQLTTFVAELGGLHARVGERGRTVSGGQRQRFALASALLREAPVLLLDDVTSALDAEVEAALLDALRIATAPMTVVFATHRPAPVRLADEVLDLTPYALASRAETGERS